MAAIAATFTGIPLEPALEAHKETPRMIIGVEWHSGRRGR